MSSLLMLLVSSPSLLSTSLSSSLVVVMVAIHSSHFVFWSEHMSIMSSSIKSIIQKAPVAPCFCDSKGPKTDEKSHESIGSKYTIYVSLVPA